MSYIHRLLAAASAAFFIASSALAQNAGSVTNHAFVLGKGAGTTGYTSLLCGSAQLAVGQAAADPICRTLTGDVTLTAAGVTAIGANKVTNAMFAAMAANTTKCNATGGSAVPTDCDASTMRTNIGLSTGTSGHALPYLDTNVTWSGGTQIFSGGSGNSLLSVFSTGATANAYISYQNGTRQWIVGADADNACASASATAYIFYDQTSTACRGWLAGDGGWIFGSSTTSPGAGNLNLTGGALWNNGTAPTGTGAYVRATNPALVTPNLGTPSAAVLTNATGLPTTALTGTLQAAQEPAHTGDCTNSAGSLALACTKINGVDQTAAWTTYTPSVAAQTGSGVTATISGRYKQIGKTIIAQADITITAVGTGSGGLVVGLPFTAAAFQYAGACREYNLTGAAGAALVLASASTMDLRTAAGATYIALNNKIVATITYEVP